MLKLYAKIFVFCLAMMSCCKYLQYAADDGLRKHQFTDDAFSIIKHQKNNADILILGSSRAKNQYIPAIIGNGTYSVFNAGEPGSNFLMQKFILEQYLKRNSKPKAVIWNIEAYTFELQKKLFNDECFIPYLDDTDVNALLKNFPNNYTWSEKHLPLFKYNNKFPLLSIGLEEHYTTFNFNKRIAVDGYKPNPEFTKKGFMNTHYSHPFGTKAEILPELVSQFIQVVTALQKQGIKVILVVTPEYYKLQETQKDRSDLNRLFQKIVQESQAVLLNYSNDSMKYDIKNYFDADHFNNEGAIKFSRHLSNDLKNYLPIFEHTSSYSPTNAALINPN